MRAEINPKVMHRLLEGAIAGVGREVRTEEKDFYWFPSLVSAAYSIKQFIGLMPKLVLPILVNPWDFKNKPYCLTYLITSLLGSLHFQLRSLPREKGNLEPQID